MQLQQRKWMFVCFFFVSNIYYNAITKEQLFKEKKKKLKTVFANYKKHFSYAQWKFILTLNYSLLFNIGVILITVKYCVLGIVHVFIIIHPVQLLDYGYVELVACGFAITIMI